MAAHLRRILPTASGNNPIPLTDVPLIQMQTQTEVNATAAMGNKYRKPDSDAPGKQVSVVRSRRMPPTTRGESQLSSRSVRSL
jgi:hypothetical protein